MADRPDRRTPSLRPRTPVLAPAEVVRLTAAVDDSDPAPAVDGRARRRGRPTSSAAASMIERLGSVATTGLLGGARLRAGVQFDLAPARPPGAAGIVPGRGRPGRVTAPTSRCACVFADGARRHPGAGATGRSGRTDVGVDAANVALIDFAAVGASSIWRRGGGATRNTRATGRVFALPRLRRRGGDGDQRLRRRGLSRLRGGWLARRHPRGPGRGLPGRGRGRHLRPSRCPLRPGTWSTTPSLAALRLRGDRVRLPRTAITCDGTHRQWTWRSLDGRRRAGPRAVPEAACTPADSSSGSWQPDDVRSPPTRPVDVTLRPRLPTRVTRSSPSLARLTGR